MRNLTSRESPSGIPAAFTESPRQVPIREGPHKRERSPITRMLIITEGADNYREKSLCIRLKWLKWLKCWSVSLVLQRIDEPRVYKRR